MGQRLQSSRYELKFIIDEAQASEIVKFVTSYLEPDPFNPPDVRGYPICSLYLDSPNLRLYDATVQGHKNRYKLRIRFYDNEPSHSAFVEIKRRETDVIKKKRAAVNRDGARLILAGESPRVEFLYKQNGSSSALDALYEFCRLRDQIRASGVTYVYYRREAYVSPASSHIRVTFDRGLQAGDYEIGSKLELPQEVKKANVGGVVLELKFTDRFPNWMRDLSEIFNLQRTSVPKYVKCVDALGVAEKAMTGRPRYMPL